MPPSFSSLLRVLGFTVGCAAVLHGQIGLDIRPTDPVEFPIVIDSNSPTFWRDGKLHLYSSTGEPKLSIFTADFQHLGTQQVVLDRRDHLPMWIQSVWQDNDGTMYAWYHYERVGVCQNTVLNVPEIGALMSLDGGKSFTDLGIILTSGEPTNCNSQNGYFANGHGDFSVILDRQGEYFYFLFGAYGGDVSAQGVSIARMAFASRRGPVGSVQKYHQGGWTEPGLGGLVTPIFPPAVSWHEANTDALWGPSIHWNTHLRRYVMLMNHSCCTPKWPQRGVYITMSEDLADPSRWTEPQQIVAFGDWYPWVMAQEGEQPGSEAGQRVRLFMRGLSDREIVFFSEPSEVEVSEENPATRLLIPPR